MKIKSILVALAVSSLSVFGQGQVNFLTPSASSTYRIFLNDNLGGRVQMPITANAFTFYVIYGATGGSLSQTTANVFNSTFTTGKINESAAGSATTVAVSLTTPIDFEIFGYSTAAGSYAAAQVANSGFYAGHSAIGVNLLPSQSPSPAQTLFSAAVPGFDLFLAPVPEPATIALAGMGAAALFLFRRRK
jgi:hypothetical protein